MRVLLVGKGGREHALAWKLSQSKLLTSLHFWPGNAAMLGFGESLALANDATFELVVAAAKGLAIDLVVCGPEAPLSCGLADAFAAAGIATFGPKQGPAQLEASKAFAKEVMRKAGIPTAAYSVCRGEEDCRRQALGMLERTGGVVLKASGLAAGKGVFVCTDAGEVENGLRRLFHSDMCAAAATVVLEEVLHGRECSYFAWLGQQRRLSLGFAVDFKRLSDGDQGPNTGGMGCYTPVPWLPANASAQVHAVVIEPLLKALAAEGMDYQGCLYVGLMWSPTVGPQVIEFNVRLGDPECQVLALADDRDWLEMIAQACGLIEGGAACQDLSTATDARATLRRSVAVVMAASSYPYGTSAGETAELPQDWFAGPRTESGATAFAGSVQAGTAGGLVTGAGRTLTVVARGTNFMDARRRAYARVEAIAARWPGAQWRQDIGLQVANEEHNA